jgi:hypothetical protein
MRSRSSSGTPRFSDIFSTVTVVMLTTAGVTAFATSVNPLDVAGFMVSAIGIGAEADGLDA